MESKFEELCKDFDRRRPSESPAKRTFWFEAKWENDWDSVNDLLRRFLIGNAMEYLNTFNGDTGFTPADVRNMRNELCLHCGKYKEAYLGVCDGCQFKVRGGGIGV